MDIVKDLLAKCTDVKILAEGGQKKVHFANHIEFGQVVIKVGSYSHANSLERIQREVGILSDIQSVYYPKNFEFTVDAKTRQFVIVEEFIEAKELTHVKDRFSTDEDVIKLLHKLLCALEILWNKRIIHRDLKPANILITSKNEPRIIDLGIARDLDNTSLTATLAASGPCTPIYAAPEQIQNQKRMIDIRTDFFLLALLTLELLLGFHPFDPNYVGNQNSIIENILAGNYYEPEKCHNEKLVGFISKNLDVRPYRRFRTKESVFDYLDLEC